MRPPDGWNCCVISRPLWCWHRNLLPHGVSWDSQHSDREKKTLLILPSMSHSNNSRLSKNICIFFRNHPSRPYSQGVFTFHNTKLLLYTFIQGKGCYFFLIILHLSSCFNSLFTKKQVKKELKAVQRETLCLHSDTLWLAVTVIEICSCCWLIY